MESLGIFLLGPPRIERGGQTLNIDTRKATAMLAYLALTGERQTRETLAAFLWPEFEDSRAKAALRRTLSALKSAVGAEFLHITREVIGLETTGVWCDVIQFRGLLAGEPELDQLETAISLYRDDFFTGFSLRDSAPFDDWQLLQAQNLSRSLETALEKLVKSHIADGGLVEALPLAHRWLLLDPLREEVHRSLMQLYAWLGQPNAALRQYRDCVRILEEELGVPPLAETTALYEAIQSDRLTRPAQVAEEVGLLSPIPQQSAKPFPLVGRDAELAVMHKLYRQVGPDGRFLVLAGEAGIGKTALAEAFLSGLPNTPSLRARCYEGENHLAYAPFVQAIRENLHQPAAMARLGNVNPMWLAESARLLPELIEAFPNLPAGPSVDWTGASGRFLEGLGRVLISLLSGSRPGILWLDEAQWADEASLDLLAFLTRRWRDRPYLILVCWRGGDLTADHRLRQLVAETRREGSGSVVSLSRLELDDIAQLVTGFAGVGQRPVSKNLASRLYRETEGLPFLVIAYLQMMQQASSETEVWQLPLTARDLFHSHLAQTSETEGQLLQAAAVIGRGFDYDLLLSASGRREEESLPALEGLLNRHLLAEGPTGLLYDFHHHKLRELIYEEMTLVRRRLLHRRVAQAMAARSTTSQSDELAARIAAHFQAAGLEEQAAIYFRQAGDYARSLFAHGDAMQHYQNALALGHPESASLHKSCGDLHIRLGEYAAALTSYEMAASLTQPDQLAQLEHRIGLVYYRRGEWGLAWQHFERAQKLWSESAGMDDLARLYIDWSINAYRAGRTDQAISLAEQAQSTAATPIVEAQTQNMLGILARKQGDLDSAIDHFNRSLDLAEEHGFLDIKITASNNLALAESISGQIQPACDRLESALVLCLTYGDRHWEAALRSNLADLLHQLNREEESMAQFKQAVTIYADIGQEIGDARPEIWKLTEW